MWEAAIWQYAGYSVGPSYPDNYWQTDAAWLNSPTKKQNIFNCPKMYEGKSLAVPTLNVLGAKYSYGFNTGVAGNLTDPLPLAKVSLRAKTAMVMETSFGLAGRWYYWDYFGLIPHDGGSNVLFFDGHVEYRKLETIPNQNTDVFWTGTLN